MKVNVKKVVGLLVSCVLAGVVLTGCGGGSGNSSAGGPVKLGMLKNMNISEQQYEKSLNEAAQRGNFPGNMRFSITYYDNLNSMQMGLESGSIKEMSTLR